MDSSVSNVVYNGVKICSNELEKQVNDALPKSRRNNSRLEAEIKIEILV